MMTTSFLKLAGVPSAAPSFLPSLAVAGTGPRLAFGAGYRIAASQADAAHWLGDGSLLRTEHPRIRLLALKLTQLKSGPREKALACYEFVRKLPFAIAGDPHTTCSLDVLGAGSGDCFTKGTLLIALLRSIGVAARARVVLLSPGYLRGMVRGTGALVEHLFVEVLLDGDWIGVDSYAVDLTLGRAAREQLLRENSRSGYGVHLKGQVSWDGHESSFGHFSLDDPESLPVADLGAYHDIRQYLEDARSDPDFARAHKKQWAFALLLVNRRIRKLRLSAQAGPVNAFALQLFGANHRQ